MNVRETRDGTKAEEHGDVNGDGGSVGIDDGGSSFCLPDGGSGFASPNSNSVGIEEKVL